MRARGAWRLEIGGAPSPRPLRLTLADLMALPRTELRLEHFCVEGWSAVSVRAGVRLSELARRVGPLARRALRSTSSRSTTTITRAGTSTARCTPQTLIVYGQDGDLLGPAFGAPARVYSPVKLGLQEHQVLTRILFLPERNGGYWSDQGYEWYGGV